MLNYIENTCKELMDTIRLDDFSLDEVNPFGFIMRKNSMVLEINNIKMIGMTIVNFSTDNNPVYYPAILIDENFVNMKPAEKEFFIYHELGHWFKQKDQILTGDSTRNIYNEFEADEFAAELLGYEKAIDALESTIYTLCKLNIDADIDEIRIRINNLKAASIATC